MTSARMEAFSDGVIAVLITIMVLELKPPEEPALHDLRELLPQFLVYVLSFVMLGIYWNNHHHLLAATERISGAVLWANLHLLFWLSLFPFCTEWMGKNHAAEVPTAVYGVVLLAASLAYYLLSRAIIAAQAPGSVLQRAIGSDRKGKASSGVYAVALGLAFVAPWVSTALYVLVALLWLVPDRRVEERLVHE
jgi:uncharacterized membrane protein